MEVLFWLSLFTIAFVYAGYPLFLWLVSGLHTKKVEKRDWPVKVSVLISAYNEESHIAKTVENKLALDYPRELLEIVVISDGSTDGTEAVVKGFEKSGVLLLVQKERQGKTAALNRAAGQASGEILVFSDANSIYDRSALKKLVSNFADPRVGYVTGKMVYVDEGGSLVGDGCSAYMKYENKLRELETKVNSVVGVDGGVDAVRKSLFQPMRPDQLPDFVLPLKVIEQGYRVVYEEEALLKEHSLTETGNEMRMRVRVALRSFHALWDMRKLFNPFRSGFFAFQILVHKGLRYMVGFLQIFCLAVNVFLAQSHPAYAIILGFQILFYACALMGLVLAERVEIKLFRYAYYFCLLNASAVVAFFKFVSGQKQVIWQPRGG